MVTFPLSPDDLPTYYDPTPAACASHHPQLS